MKFKVGNWQELFMFFLHSIVCYRTSLKPGSYVLVINILVQCFALCLVCSLALLMGYTIKCYWSLASVIAYTMKCLLPGMEVRHDAVTVSCVTQVKCSSDRKKKHLETYSSLEYLNYNVITVFTSQDLAKYS